MTFLQRNTINFITSNQLDLHAQRVFTADHASTVRNECAMFSNNSTRYLLPHPYTPIGTYAEHIPTHIASPVEPTNEIHRPFTVNADVSPRSDHDLTISAERRHCFARRILGAIDSDATAPHPVRIDERLWKALHVTRMT